MKVLLDFHHGSLLRSLVLLFERMGIDAYRPIGMEWYPDNWDVFRFPGASVPAYDTARQYLGLEEQAFVPTDGTPFLNEVAKLEDGVYWVYDAGRVDMHRGCTLQYFREHDFQFMVASIPQHLPIFDRLAQEQRARGVDCQVLMQIGNEWPLDQFAGRKVLASIKPRQTKAECFWYHQEFQQSIFHEQPAWPSGLVTCFMNCLREQEHAHEVFLTMENRSPAELIYRSYGGQCRDGCMTGHHEMAGAIAQSMAILHPKSSEGYGHIIYNTYSVGRPAIIHRHMLDQYLCGELFSDETCLNLDNGIEWVIGWLSEWMRDPTSLVEMGRACRGQFDKCVDFEAEAEGIAAWLGIA